MLRSVTAAEFVPAAKLSTPPISVNFVPEAFNAILSHPELSFVIEMPEEEVPLTFHAAVMSPARRELTISSDNDQEITYAKIGGGWALITARHIDGMTTRFVTNLPPNGLQGQHLVDAVAPLTATRDDDGLRQQRRDISEHLSRNWIRAKDPRPYECALVAAESMNVTGN